MSTLREQLSAARKAQVELQLDFVRNLTDNVVDSTGKVVALNLNTGRNTFEKSADALRKLVTANNPRELIDLTRASQAGFDSLLSYGSELFNIASRAQANLIKAATPAAIAAPAQALRALPVEVVEVEVQAEVQPEQADPDAVAAVPLDEVAVAEPLAEAEPAAAAASAPEAEPVAEAEAAAEPAPAIIEEVRVPAETLQAKPLAEAVSAAIGTAQPPVLEASPIVSAPAAQVEISGIEPVEATPPQAPVQADAPATKSRRKKER